MWWWQFCCFVVLFVSFVVSFVSFVSFVVQSQVMSNCFATPWIIAHQAPLSMGFPMHDYWSGLPFPSPGDLPNLGMELLSPSLKADSLPLSHKGRPVVSDTLLQQNKFVQQQSIFVAFCLFASQNAFSFLLIVTTSLGEPPHSLSQISNSSGTEFSLWFQECSDNLDMAIRI